MKPPIDGMEIRPYGEEHMLSAWIDFLSWASKEEHIVEEYIKATGVIPIDMTEDQTEQYCCLFADWLTVYYWGEERKVNGNT